MILLDEVSFCLAVRIFCIHISKCNFHPNKNEYKLKKYLSYPYVYFAYVIPTFELEFCVFACREE